MGIDTSVASDSQLIHDIIGHIYDASCDSDKWHIVLKKIAQLTNSKSAVLLYQDHDVQHASTFSSYGLDPKWLALYNATYGERDPSLAIIGAVPTGELTASHLAHENIKLYESDTYKEFYKPQNIHHLAGSWLIKNEYRSALLGFQRALSAPEYENETLSKVKELVPHLQKALYIHRVYTEAKIKSETSEAGMDVMQTGIVLFDNQSQVIYCNKAAESIINQHPAIGMRHDTVFATSNECNKKLSQAIRAASLANLHKTQTDPISLGLHCSGVYTALPVLIMPSDQSEYSGKISRGGAASVMIITDPDRILLASPDLLTTIYNFTKKEAEVAICLANAMTAPEIAESKNVKISTVRSQTQSIFAKLGISSQAQLVKIILDSPIAAAR